ncbi:FMN-dependent NADH-azoreductase [Spiroplasma endosymbiont of Amphibalanus improvisus]|uniref:FMN-dependent NADH-azoreductase n=1 Tax=Spiroplasma endosymbiont of Amphibalanus improvisus TaxID=3066327 RepID=UPI00313DBAF4
MSKILVIKTSMIQEEKSISTALVNRFIKYYKKKNQLDEINTLDLNTVEMANITMNQENFNDKSFFNSEHSARYIEQLKNVNKIVFVSPMTNFNITALAKNYLDHILVADKTFSYKYAKEGASIGLLPHLKVQILTTQGAPFGWYQWGNHTKYLEGTWNFVGARIAKSINICGTKLHENSNLMPEQLIDKYDLEIKLAAEKF